MRPYMQVKAYVRVHGPPEETDKGYVSLSYNDHVTGSGPAPRARPRRVA